MDVNAFVRRNQPIVDRRLAAGTIIEMNGIQIAAVITSLLAIAAFGTLIWQLCDAKDQAWLFGLALFALPMSPLAYYCVRLPLHGFLTEWLTRDSILLTICQLCYAPVTEEPAKLLPLFLAWLIFRDWFNRSNIVLTAMSLGLGFAIGEIGLVASLIGRNPDFSKLPFYAFGGFLNERLATCIAHAGFTSLALWGLQFGTIRRVAGLLGAMTFHFLSNFPIFLMNVDFARLGKPAWSILVSVWLLFCVIVSALLLAIMHAGTKRIVSLMTTAKVKCPECGEFYRQPILGGNFGVWRYEPCGACRKWHWISLKDIQ